MEKLLQHLNSGWEYAFCDHGSVKGPQAAARLRFRPATVPGVNLSLLQRDGLVKPDTAVDYEDSFRPYALKDFVFRTVFSGAGAAGKKKVFLCFEGLDTVAEVFLNGRRVGAAENAHLEYRFDVKKALVPGANSLFVIFRSPVHEAWRRKKLLDRGFNDILKTAFMFIRKPAYSYFWDWGPSIPVSGIHRPVTLLAYDRAVIDDYHVRYKITGKRVRGEVTVLASGADGAKASVLIDNRLFSAIVRRGTARVTFRVDNVRLWWPNGEGDPVLYDMEVRLGREGLLDEKMHRIGFRTIRLAQPRREDNKGTRFSFVVNGKEVFCRGYNWIPVDNDVPRGFDLYRGNLDLAQKGNVNMLRVWGGGYYEDNEFYRLCDERGILVWQDGMFACASYPDQDPGFMASVKEELACNIRRLRNFTSLALWCGENESHQGFDEWGWKTQGNRFYGARIYDRLFPALVRKLDPDRFYWNGSPYSGKKGVKANNPMHGDTHFWDLFARTQDYSSFDSQPGGFISETGIQGLPDLRTALTIVDKGDESVGSFAVDTRNHWYNPSKNERLIKFGAARYRIKGDFKNDVILSNLGEAEYLKYAVEHWRSMGHGNCDGVLVWQLNDCWPAISWSTVDYNLIPKAAWYFLREAYANDLVIYRQKSTWKYFPDQDCNGKVYVASERDGLKTGEVLYRAVRLNGEVVEKRSMKVRLNGRGVACLGDLTLPDYRKNRFDCVAEFVLKWNGKEAARNLYTFTRPKYMKIRKPRLSLVQDGAQGLTVRAESFVKSLYLFHPDKKVVFGDNYFDMLPGEKRTVKASTPFSVKQVRPMAYFH